MKKIVTIMIIAVLAVTSVFAATAVAAPDYTFTGKAGWVRISGEDAVTANVDVDRRVFTNDDFTIGVEADFGAALFVTEGARFTQYIGPTFTFEGIEPAFDLIVGAGVKFVEYTDFFDWGVGGTVKLVQWVEPGCGLTIGFDATRLLKTHTNSYGVTLGITCQL